MYKSILAVTFTFSLFLGIPHHVLAVDPCQGVNVDDKNPCTTDKCVTGKVFHNNNFAPCNDNNGCTTNDLCKNGKCEGSPTKTCPGGTKCDAAGNCQQAQAGTQSIFNLFKKSEKSAEVQPQNSEQKLMEQEQMGGEAKIYTVESMLKAIAQKRSQPRTSPPPVGTGLGVSIIPEITKAVDYTPCYSGTVKHLGMGEDFLPVKQLDGCLLNYTSEDISIWDIIFNAALSGKIGEDEDLGKNGLCEAIMCVDGACTWKLVALISISGDICQTLREAQINVIPVRVKGNSYTTNTWHYLYPTTVSIGQVD